MASFTNQATLRYQGSEIRSNVVTGELLSGAAVSKTAVESAYLPGERITYIVTLVNSGAGALGELTLTDDLGGVLFDGQTVYPLSYVADSAKLFVNGVQQPVGVTAGPPLQFTGISLPAQGSAVLVYDAVVTEFAQPTVGGSITNTVSLNEAAQAEEGTAQWTLPVAQQPLLEILKEVSPIGVQPNEPLTYRFTLRNYGNTATDNTLVLTDVFQPVLQNLTVTLDGQPLTEGVDYAYDEDTGSFETAEGVLFTAAAVSTQTADGSWQTVPSEQVLTVTGTI